MGEKLKRIRISKHISQEQLSEMSGISRITIYKIESGKVKNIKTQTLFKLCEALECSPFDIFLN